MPCEWIYSYNRGMQFTEDVETHKDREECKFCLFNVDVLKSNNKQIKIDELEDETLLRLWHGNDYSKSDRQ